MPATDGAVGPETSPYVWTFPGSPIKVAIDLRTVSHLQQETAATDGEVHGLLSGQIRDGQTEIRGFIPTVEFSATELEQAASPLGESVVGCYRIRAGDELRLTEEEKLTGSSLCNRPGSVFLLVLRRTPGPAAATFFFTDSIGIGWDYGFLEFPVDAAKLVESQRERNERAREKEQSWRGSAPAATAPRRRSRVKLAAWLAAAILIGIGGFGLGYRFSFLPRLAEPAGGSAAPVIVDATGSVALRAQRQGEDLRITWDSDAPVIAQAASGVLTIEDGESTRRIDLDAGNLRFGSVLYTPAAEQLGIHLATHAAGRETGRGSVLVLLRKAALQPTAPVRVAPVRSTTKPAAMQSIEPQPAAAAPSSVSVEPPQPAALEIPPEVRTAPPPVETALLGAPRILPAPAIPPRPQPRAVEAPPVERRPVAADAGPTPPAVTARHQPVVAEPLTPPVAIHKAQPSVPNALRPLLMKPVTVEVKVTIDERGAVTGAEPVRFGREHELLVSAAVNAARAWKFRPARRGDRPVPADVVLQFRFTSPR